MTRRLACPCCGYATLPERDLYELCPVCFWEDDPSESRSLGFAGGANGVTLVAAQRTYLRIGAMHPSFLDKVRPPRPDEARVADWHEFETSTTDAEPVITRDEAGRRLGIATWCVSYKAFQGDLAKATGPDPLIGYVTESSVHDEAAWQVKAGPLKRIRRMLGHLIQWF